MGSGLAKVGAELIEQGVRTGLKQLGRKGAKEVGDQLVKNVPTPKLSTDDWYSGLYKQKKWPKKLSQITEGDIKANDSAQMGSDRPDIERTLEGLQSKDPVIKEDSYSAWNEYLDGVRGANHFSELDHQAEEAAAIIAGVRQPRAGTRWQDKGTRASGGTPERANIHNTPEQVAAGEAKYKSIAATPGQAPHHGLSFADGAKINNRFDSDQVLRHADSLTEVSGPIGHTIENLQGSYHKFNAKARADKIGSILEQKPEWSDPVIKWEDPVLGPIEIPRKRLLSDLVKDTTDTNMPGSDTRFNWNSIGIPNGKKGEARWPSGNLVTDNQRRAAWVNRYQYHNLNAKDFRIDPAGDIKGFDHVDIGHTISEGSPEYQALKEMIDDPNKYATYSVEEAGKIIADWRNLQRRVFVNINQMRLDFIMEELGLKVRIGKTKYGRPRFKYTNAAKNLGYVNEQNPGLVPEKIQAFMNENPARAAIVGYRDLGMKNDEAILKMLRQEPKEVTPMLQQLFSMAEENVASMDVPATVEAAEQLAQMYPGN